MDQLSKLSDHEIVIKYLQEKDLGYLGLLLNRHKTNINMTIMRVLKGYGIFGDRAKDAWEDIFQNIFIKAIEEKTLGTEEEFGIWIRRIAHNEARKKVREIITNDNKTVSINNEEENLKEIIAVPDPEPIIPDTWLEHIEQFKEILGKKHSDIFRMYYFDGYTANEIAKKYNTTESSIRVTLNRLTKRFTTFLRGKGLL